MGLSLFDTMTRVPVELVPMDGREFRFYCCGPTVYGPAHIGNFRTFVLQDVFRRVLELGGLKVKHVRNLTDVDDKTIRVSQEVGKSPTSLRVWWTEQFHWEFRGLHWFGSDSGAGGRGSVITPTVRDHHLQPGHHSPGS